jgi:hypothetical protein
MGTLPITRGQSGRRVVLVTHPYPAPKFKNEQNYSPRLTVPSCHIEGETSLLLYFNADTDE